MKTAGFTPVGLLRHLAFGLTVFLAQNARGDLAPPAPPGAPAEAPAPAAEGSEAPEGDPLGGLPRVTGPADGTLGEEATVKIPAGHVLLNDQRSIKKFYDLTQNTTSGKERGVVFPVGTDTFWWLDFSFDPVGYVKDDDADELDADELLKAKQEGQEQGNAERRKRGWEDLHVTGWHTPPKYDAATHNLEWGIKLQSGKDESINYEIRMLGRRGVMSATLIGSAAVVDATLPLLRTLLAGFAFTQGADYGSYQDGDKIAEYGLGALVAGGTLALLAKTGVLAKFWKFIVAGVVGIGAFFSRFFGKKKAAPTPSIDLSKE